ncbi:MAG: acyl-CoA dehydrogenase family protein [Solirubrobacterales bacterium]
MRLTLSEDQLELHSVAREAMADLAPLSLARSFLEGEGDAAALQAELGDLGWYGVGLEDDGFGVLGLCLLAERCGAQAAPNCLVDTAVAARLACSLDRDDELVGRVAAGEVPTALAVIEPEADWSLEGAAARLSARGEAFTLSGTKLGVQLGASVEAFLVSCDHDGERAFALLAADQAGCISRSAPSLDAAAATVELELESVAVPQSRALSGRNATEAIDRAFRVGAVATAAEAVGASSAALDLAVAYAKEREQFGAPIGSFQALKHLLADAHVDRESALASVLFAAAAIDEQNPSAEEAATVAKAYASRASRAAVEAALQVFGGIAFTWEHDAHLLQRRVLAAERRFGDAIQHERHLGRMLAARRQGAAA